MLVLEAGPAWQRSDLVSSQIWARRLKWAAAPVETTGSDPYGHAMASGGGLGGSALHHFAGWPRLQLDDFRMRSRFDRGRDWPIGYDDLRPHYDRVQAEVGISGDAAAEVWRPGGAAYPLPPLATFAQGRLLAEGFRRRGLRTAPYPSAILSRPYRGRPACLYDGWCDAGCPILALANPLALYLPQARESGARVLDGMSVARIRVDARDRVVGVDGFDRDGAVQSWRAPVVVLAGGPVHNARLLLLSADEGRHRTGLANSSGLVGQGIASHVLVPAHALFDTDTECHMGITGAQLMSQDDYPKQRTEGFGSITWAIASALKPNDLLGIANARPDLYGASLHGFMRRAGKHLATMSAICETMPQTGNRIELGTHRDRFGLPVPRIVHSLGADAKALAVHAREDGLATLKAAGAQDAFSARPGLAHLAGGTVMGERAADSVVDSFGHSHDVRGLVVAGAGVFPTIGAVNPTFTIHALASRTADHMKKNWSSYAGRA